MVNSTPSDCETPRKNPALDALIGLATSGIRPAATTRRTNNLPLHIAFAAHVLAALAFVLSIPLLDALNPYRGLGFGFLKRWIHGIASIIEEGVRYPIAASMTVIGCEAAVLCVAVLLVAWGARDEPMADSFRHAIRRTWLHCGHLVIVTLLAGGLIIVLTHVEYRHRREIQSATAHLIHPTYPRPPTQAALDEYNNKVEDYRSRYDAAVKRIPADFFVRHSNKIASFAVMAGSIWFLAALMRGVAADRPHRRQPEEILCRECGYNLVATDPESRCPECGRPVRWTLAPPPELAPSWEQARGLASMPRAYVRSVWRATTQCRSLALALPPIPANHRYRWFLGLNLSLCGIAALLLCLATLLMLRTRDDDMLWLGAFWLSAVWALFVLGVLLLCAIIVGIAVRVRTGRNRLAPINHLACYLSGFLVAWTAVFWFAVLVAAQIEDLFRAWCREMRIPTDAAVMFCFGTFNCVMVIWLLVKLWRASSGVRYPATAPAGFSHAGESASDNAL